MKLFSKAFISLLLTQIIGCAGDDRIGPIGATDLTKIVGESQSLSCPPPATIPPGTPCKEVRTLNDLKAIGDNLAGYYCLMNDIDLGGSEWSPLGGDGRMSVHLDVIEGGVFTGTLEGNNHTLANLKITQDETHPEKRSNLGLFNAVSGIVRNLKFSNVQISAGQLGAKNDGGFGPAVSFGGVGALTAVNCGTLSSISMDGTMTGYFSKSSSGTITYCTGGIVGLNFGSISKSAAKGKFAGTFSVGGLVGASLLGKIEECTTSGSGTSSDIGLGGLVGAAGQTSISKSSSSVTLQGGSDIGGLIGSAQRMSISDSSASGNVSGTTEGGIAGGLVGSIHEVSLTNVSATGKIPASRPQAPTGQIFGHEW